MSRLPVGARDLRSADIGVAIVAFRAAGFIGDCLDSLFASHGARVRAVVVDNASPDGTVDAVRQWAIAHPQVGFAEGAVGEIDRAEADLTLLRSSLNGGFAYASNRGLEVLLADPALSLLWMLNPDCTVLPDTAARFVTAGADQAFSLMGGRIVYLDNPGRVQCDGGRVSRYTGTCSLINMGQPLDTPPPAAAAVDFVSGACCVISRRFIETTGLMREDYFLYYEEVDWALRRGDLPLRHAPEAVVRHVGGATIGSGVPGRRPSAFANYFNYRNRIRFMRRFAPARVPLALAYGLAKAAQLALKGAWAEAHGVLAGIAGAPPPASVRAQIAPEARALAFGRDG